MGDRFPSLPVPCGDCGRVWPMSGRWAEVAYKLSEKTDEVRLFFRCPACGSMSYNPELDLLTGVLEFFHVISPPELNGRRVLEVALYDVGSWAQLAGGGEDSPLTGMDDIGGHGFKALPGLDLTSGVCAPKGVLPLKDVKLAIAAVNIAFPP